MSDRRTISVDPALFAISSFGTRKKREKKAKDPSTGIKVKVPSERNQKNTMKNRSILNLIRKHQQDRIGKIFNKNKKPTESVEEKTFNSEFKEAQNFLEHLSKQTEKVGGNQNKTLKQRSVITQPIMPVNLPVLDTHLVENVSLEFPTEVVQRAPVPIYGCLKNGKLPTYRTYMNQTRKQYPVQSASPVFQPTLPVIQPSIVSPLLTQPSVLHNVSDLEMRKGVNKIHEFKQMENKIRELQQFHKPKRMKQKKTRRRTYKVGRFKHLPKIGVLVSNRTIRNNVSTKTQQLKQIPIEDVRKHLIKCGLLKIGSTAPNDVLRKMYESTQLLCGEIQNHNPDNLLHNFLHADSP
jgi:hypothetical protein